MSGKRKKSSLSQSSVSSSELSDAGRQLEILASKKHKQSSYGGSSAESDGGERKRSRSKSQSKSGGSRSASGSDSGTARSRSGSGSGSGSAASRKGSGSGSGSGSGRGRNSSDGSDSGTGGSGGRAAGSGASHRSSGSDKGKKLLKASERRASSKLQSTLSNESDSELEDNPPPKEAKKIPKIKKKSHNSSDENKLQTWREEFDDGLDSDLVGDDDDRDNLNDMTEKQREEELFKRAERREELKKRFEISQKLRLQQKNKREESDRSMNSNSEGEKEKVSSYPAADMNHPGERRKGYEEKHAKKFSALSNLKAMREEKEKKESQRKEKEKKSRRKHGSGSGSESDMEKIGGSSKKKKMKASDIYSSSSSEGEKEVRRKSSSSSSSSSSSVSSISSGESDTERNKSKKVVKKARLISTREELEKIRLSRYKMDKFVHLPIFKKTVVGCFVRIGIGHNKEKDVPVYRVAEIVDICETAKVYDVMKSRTNIGLRIKHGKDERVFRAQFISNSPFTDSEFLKWRQTCEKQHVELPSNQVVDEKLQSIHKAMTYRFNSNDVDKILASKEKFSKHPHNYAKTKTKLLKQKGQAQDDGNVELKMKLETQLEELEERAEELDKKRTGSISTISLVNDRNRKNNIKRAEISIIREARKVKLEGHIDDPFTRRKTVPKIAQMKVEDNLEDGIEMTTERLLMLEQIKQEKVEKEKRDKDEQMENIRRKMNDEDGLTKKERKKMAAGSSKASSQDIFNAHDFDIDINVSEMTESLMPGSIVVKPVTASTAASSGPTKRSLKLEEWKKRRGIM